MRYPTTYILNTSRIPDHFYALVKGLSGREATYNNPGTSLRSFVLAGTNILQQSIDVEGEMLDILRECEDFSGDEKVYETINNALRTKPYEVLELILAVEKDPDSVKDAMKQLNSMNRKVDEAWETLTRNTLEGQAKNMWSNAASDYKQAIIDLKTYASELVIHYESLLSA